jgi:hypothetical protein
MVPARAVGGFGDFAGLLLGLEELEEDSLFARERGVAVEAAGEAAGEVGDCLTRCQSSVSRFRG